MSSISFSLDCLHPVFRFCPKCGEKSFTQNSDKSFSCTQCGHLYFINPGGAVAGIITNTDGKILLVRRAGNPGKGLLDLPGGFVDIGETAETALKREIKEELNVEITGLRFLATFPNRYLYREVQYFTLDLAFECSVLSFDSIKAADDVAGFEFFQPEQVPLHEIAFESIRNIILFLQEGIKK